jgi:Holliday junction resolvase RusA-like endonuclease
MARARHGKGFTYRDPAQEAYAQRVQAEWIAAGRPCLVDGPYRVHMIAALGRPKAHRRADGSLSAAGRRSPRPTRKPDADNLLKQLDPLVAVGALPDDALVVDARVEKVWADREDGPHLVVYATSLVAELDGREAA